MLRIFYTLNIAENILFSKSYSGLVLIKYVSDALKQRTCIKSFQFNEFATLIRGGQSEMQNHIRNV